MHWMPLTLHRKHVGLSPVHLDFAERQLRHERYVRFLLGPLTANIRDELPVLTDGEAAGRPSQSRPRRSQLMHPFGRPSHLTFENGVSAARAFDYVVLSAQYTLRARHTLQPIFRPLLTYLQRQS